MHDFFLERDYPAATELARVAKVLTPEFQMPDLLRQRLKMDAATFDRAAEKLAAQGAAAFDIEGLVRSTGNTTWQTGYDAQLDFRRSQIDRMVAFAESAQCRMAALVQHFGDTADGRKPCGHCDFCAPESASAQPFRQPTSAEDRHLRAILAALKGGVSRSTGKLHAELALTPDRKLFDTYLDALSRAGLLKLTTDTFTNPEGVAITYKKATLTHEGAEITPTGTLHALLRDTTSEVPDPSPRRTRGGKESGRHSKATLKAARERTTAACTPAQQALEDRLREWRKAEAGKTGKPAFIVCGDATLRNLAMACPQNLPELLTVSGIGPEKADRYGAEIVAICRGGEPPILHIQEVFVSRPAQLPTRPSEMSQEGHHVPRAKPPSKPLQRTVVETTKVPNAERYGFTAATSTPTFTRQRAPQPEPEAPLTPGQQALDTLLRDWRKAEAARLGLPQFFVLSSSTLRDIVLRHPKSMPHLQAISGIGTEKLDRFGSAILGICNQL
jgi:ATP-dependent DNA helicase RecQ